MLLVKQGIIRRITGKYENLTNRQMLLIIRRFRMQLQIKSFFFFFKEEWCEMRYERSWKRVKKLYYLKDLRTL
ncbi:MAG: hypothetical protein D8M57_03435 [Candidatus Scalindua sp. AMX11]|nr:MAG: hypothetical protein DWQ00_11255 [Candidatus Scalindua sp.]TDE66168.1 MAG: hypothetical protein D8M57_03435 [Candidatus Scalindua sp. AMX11]